MEFFRLCIAHCNWQLVCKWCLVRLWANGGYAVRKLTAVIGVAAIVAAGFPPVPVFAQARIVPTSATPAAPVDQAALISSTIKAFPNGGEPLKIAISDLIVKHRELAASLATYLRTEPSLTSAQKQAIVAGLGNGLNRLGIVAADLGVRATGAPATGAPAADGTVGSLDPWLIALLVGAAGVGVWALTRVNTGGTTVAGGTLVSPN